MRARGYGHTAQASKEIRKQVRRKLCRGMTNSNAIRISFFFLFYLAHVLWKRSIRSLWICPNSWLPNQRMFVRFFFFFFSSCMKRFGERRCTRHLFVTKVQENGPSVVYKKQVLNIKKKYFHTIILGLLIRSCVHRLVFTVLCSPSGVMPETFFHRSGPAAFSLGFFLGFKVPFFWCWLYVCLT